MTAQKSAFALLLFGVAAGCGDRGSGSATETAGNAAPTISGTPSPTAPAGTRYRFVPAAHDPDGDRIIFSIRNKPDWARFDKETGRLSGTPTERDAGRTNGIEISAWDGRTTTILPSFNLEVVLAATRSVTLSWIPPTANEDGEALFDLAGFRIYYGKRSGEFPYVIDVTNPGLTSFVVENLAPGTYYFATTALDVSGNESPMSEVIEVML